MQLVLDLEIRAIYLPNYIVYLLLPLLQLMTLSIYIMLNAEMHKRNFYYVMYIDLK